MRELGKRARSVRARKTLDGGVETFPARPRYRPQALEGGTSPRRRDRFDQPKLMTGRVWGATASPRPTSSSFGRLYSSRETSRLPGPAEGVVDGLGASLRPSLKLAFLRRRLLGPVERHARGLGRFPDAAMIFAALPAR